MKLRKRACGGPGAADDGVAEDVLGDDDDDEGEEDEKVDMPLGCT